MQDKLVRATAAQGNIRIVAANTTRLVEKAHIIHGTYPTATAALGRILTAALLIGAGLKHQETITIRIEGDGPLGVLLAVADNKGKVKGYVSNPHVYIEPVETGKMDVGRAVGQGMLYVIRDLKLKGVYTGSSPLISGEIGDDLSHYFYSSEQIPTAVGLGVLVDKDTTVKGAGGYIVQLMPNASEEIVSHIEQKVMDLGAVSSYIEKGKESMDIVKYICEPWDVVVHEEREVDFECDCSRSKIEKVVISLGEEEIKDIINKDQKAELVCHFCNKNYHLEKEELLDLLEKAKK
jgi:molecular chaperone Hsp33